jgi:hypothetical protein
MSKHDDGGAAYAHGGNEVEESQRGMSLLDYFAAHAPEQVNDDADMEWLSVRTGIPLPANMKNGVEMADWWARVEASLRYRFASAMLAEKRRLEGGGQ